MFKLKPCPFCGGEAQILIIKEQKFHSVRCIKCRTLTDIYETEEEAIEAWNRRAE